MSRVDFNALSYVFRRFAFITFFFEISDAFLNESLNEMLRERRERRKLRKNKKIKNDDDVVDVDNYLKKKLRNLNDDEFVNFFQYLHEFNQAKSESQVFKRKKRKYQSIEYREKKSLKQK